MRYGGFVITLDKSEYLRKRGMIWLIFVSRTERRL